MKYIKYVIVLIFMFGFIGYVNADNVKRGTFTFNDVTSKYYYSDDYFTNSGEDKNEHLRTFSYILSIQSRDKDDIKSLMEEVSLKDIKDYDYDKNDKDTMGVIIGNKTTSDGSLVVVTLRGIGYGAEWLSNLSLGSSGNPEGFDKASNLVIERIKEYLESNEIHNPKILVCGYSRAGGVANLVGVYLNEHLKEFELKKENIFVYTFEAPNSSVSNKVYKNIHNVVNTNDIVTYIYPSSWNIRLNGVMEDITTEDKELIIKYMDLIDGEIKDGSKISESEFISNFINFLSKDELNYGKSKVTVLTRSKYVSLEDSIDKIYRLFSDKSPDDIKKISEFMSKQMESYLHDENGKLNPLNVITLTTLMSSSEKVAIKVAYMALFSSIEKNIDEISDVLSKDEFDTFRDSFYDIFLDIQPAFSNDFTSKYNGEYLTLYKFITFGSNIETIIGEHYPLNNLVTICNKDSYYINEPEIVSGNLYVNNVLIDDMDMVSKEDNNKLNDGFDVYLSVNIKEVDNVSDNDKKLVKSLLKKDNVYKYLDISLSKMIGNNVININEYEKKIRIVYELDGDLKDKDNLGIIRIHGDEVIKLDSEIVSFDDLSESEKEKIINDKDVSSDSLKGSKYIVFYSDMFSTYAIVDSKNIKNGLNIKIFIVIVIVVIGLVIIGMLIKNKHRKI